eukprot:scpid18569/ scgid2748/ 
MICQWTCYIKVSSRDKQHTTKTTPHNVKDSIQQFSPSITAITHYASFQARSINTNNSYVNPTLANTNNSYVNPTLANTNNSYVNPTLANSLSLNRYTLLQRYLQLLLNLCSVRRTVPGTCLLITTAMTWQAARVVLGTHRLPAVAIPVGTYYTQPVYCFNLNILPGMVLLLLLLLPQTRCENLRSDQ